MTTSTPTAADLLVVDASAVLALLLDAGPTGSLVADRMNAATAIAPQLLPFEVWNGLRRQRLGPAMTRTARSLFAHLPIEVWPTEPLEEGVWSHAANLSAYDAAYVALAELTGATLLTCDARLARAPDLVCPVTVARA